MKTIKIDMRDDFSRYPAGRYVADGPFSGEKFREELLLPHLRKRHVVELNLDSGLAYGSSFLEEAFGGLVRAGIVPEDIRSLLRLRARDKTLLDEINFYIEDAASHQPSPTNG